MKKLTAIVLSFLILSVVISTLFISNCAEEKKVKIAAVLPLTGDYGLAGSETKEGIELAIEQINNDGGVYGKKVVVSYNDCRGFPAEAVSAIRKTISTENVSYVIDNSISSVTLAMAPVAEENEVVLLSTGSTAPAISKAGKFIFRIWNSDAIEGQKIVEYAADSLNHQNISILYINNDYGLGLKDVFKNEFNGKGKKIQLVLSFNAGEKDFRSLLTKVIKERSQAIYLVAYPLDTKIVLQQAKELGYKGMWLGTVTMLDPQVIQTAKDSNYKLFIPTPLFPEANESQVVMKFHDKFKQKFNKDPSILAKVGYDAAMLFKEAAILGQGTSGEHLVEGLHKIKKFEGTSGEIEFDKNGDVHKPMKILIYP